MMDLATVLQGLTLAGIVGLFARLFSLESRLSHLEGFMRAREHDKGMTA
jgi:hypothetical protein